MQAKQAGGKPSFEPQTDASAPSRQKQAPLCLITLIILWICTTLSLYLISQALKYSLILPSTLNLSMREYNDSSYLLTLLDLSISVGTQTPMGRAKSASRIIPRTNGFLVRKPLQTFFTWMFATTPAIRELTPIKPAVFAFLTTTLYYLSGISYGFKAMKGARFSKVIWWSVSIIAGLISKALGICWTITK